MTSTAQVANAKRREEAIKKFGKNTIESYTYLAYGKKRDMGGESDFAYSENATELWNICKAVIEQGINISSIAGKAEAIANKLYGTDEYWIADMLFEAVGNFNNSK